MESQQLLQFPAVITVTTAPILESRGQLSLLWVYRRKLQERFLSHYLGNLAAFVGKYIETVREPAVKTATSAWLDSILKLKEDPLEYSLWKRYFDNYLKLIEKTNLFFNSEIDKIKSEVDKIESPTEAEAGSYFIQLLENFANVFVFLHRYFTRVKEGKTGVFSREEEEIFEELSSHLVSLSSLTNEMVDSINNGEISDKIVYDYINIISALRLNVIKACVICRLESESISLTENAQGILHAYNIS